MGRALVNLNQYVRSIRPVGWSENPRRKRCATLEMGLPPALRVSRCAPARWRPPEARIARLERYVTALDDDLHEVHTTIARKGAEIVEQARRSDHEIREEIAQRDAARRAALRPSPIQQAVGTVCALAETVLATIGSL
jgi:hypothetical protein